MKKRSSFDWLSSQGLIPTLIKNHPWQETSLGAPETWPLRLKILINIIIESKMPMFVWWGPDLINIYNEAYIDLLGTDKHPKYFGQSGKAAWSEIWETIAPLVSRVQAGETFSFENQKFLIERHGKKEEAYFSFAYSPAKDDEGIIHGVFCNVLETTHIVLHEQRLKLAHEQTELAHQQLNDFFMQAPAPMVILLGDDFYFYIANAPYEELVGRKVMGKKLMEVFTREEIHHFLPSLDKVYKTGVSHIGKEIPFNPIVNGKTENRFLNIGYHPFRESDGAIKGVLAIVEDVTEHVRLTRDLKLAVKSRDEFLSIASHELRTPLTSLKMQLQLAERTYSANEKLRKVFNVSLKQVDRITALIDDLLDVSRIQTGKLTYNFVPTDLNSVIQDLVERFAGSPITFVPTNVSPVMCDPFRIDQVLTNLISNALKYGQGQAIEVSLVETSQGVEVQVKDGGIGIPGDKLQMIFDRFERVYHKDTVGGLGLGLYISKTIAEAHRGIIVVESLLQQGSTFTLKLPFSPV